MFNHRNIIQSPTGLLLALCLPVTIACIDLMALSVALSNIMHDFSVSLNKTQWLLSGYTIGTAAFLLTIGKLADIYGRRKLLLLGVFLFALSSLSAALAYSINLLIISRFVQGVASAMMMTTVISIITHHFSPQERGQVIAKWGFSLGLGMAAGPLVGGILVHWAHWRAIFAVNIPISVIAGFLIVRFIPESKDESAPAKIDWLETSLLTLLLLTLVTVLSEGNSLGWSSSIIHTLLAALIGLTITFVFVAINKKNPLIDFTLFKLPNFVGATICGFISYFCLYAWLFIFSIYLQNAHGMSPLKTGFTCSSFSVAFALSAKFLGKFIKRWGNKILMQTGFPLATIALIWMATITLHTDLWQLIFMFFLFGVAITLINAPSMASATEYVPAGKTGIASGIIFTIRWLGGSIGIVIITIISQAQLSLTAGLTMSCMALAALAVTGYICAATLIQHKARG